MTAPIGIPDFAQVYGQSNPDGPDHVSVYDGPTADPAISARTVVAMSPSELPIVGARRIDHGNATDYGFGAAGIEYVLVDADGALIPDIGGLMQVDVLDNDIEGTSSTLRSTLAIVTPPTHGAAVVQAGIIWYAPHTGYDGAEDSLGYTVENTAAEVCDETLLTLQISTRGPVRLAALELGVSKGFTHLIDPQGSVEGSPTPLVLAVEILNAPQEGTAEVIGRRVSYTSPTTFNGIDQFTWRALVNGVWTDPAIVRVRLGQAVRRSVGQRKRLIRFDIPEGLARVIANADSSSTPYGTPVNIPVLANDVGANLTVSEVQANIIGGSAVVENDDTITFTPAVNFSGTCTFKYYVTDGVRTAAALVTVEVGAPPVVAVADTVSTVLTTPVNIGVTANDVGTGLTVVAVGPRANGSASINGDGVSIDYQADAGFVGTEIFTYTVEDGAGFQSVGQITVRVLAAEFSVQNDSFTTPQGHSIELDVLANDVGTGLVVTAVGNGANGTVAISSGGAKVTYSPAPAFVGEDSFLYSVTDSFGQVLTARCFVVVTAVGTGPTALGDSVTTLGTTPVEIAVLDNDLGSGIAISGLTQPPSGKGTAVLSSGGTKITYVAPTNFSGTVTFTYTITNGFGTSTATISVDVQRPAMNIAGDSGTVANNATLDLTPLANDVGTGLSIASVGAVSPSSAGSRTQLNATTIRFTPAAGFTGVATITYNVVDSYGFTGVGTITIAVTAPPAAAYSNGYEAMATRYVGPDSEAMTGFPVLFDITDVRLRSQANGGLVRQQFKDVRLEDGAGNKLSHGLLSHDIVAGRIVGIVKRSRSATVWNKIEVYCGKQGSVVDEQDWPGATAGHLGFWRMDTGVDLTGNGRDLTPSNGTVGTLFGAPAYVCNGVNAGVQLANPSSWLNGASAYTLLLDLQHDQISVDQGFFRVGGTATGSDGSCYMMARSDAALLADPAKTALYFAKQDTSIAAVTTNCTVNGQDGRIVVGKPSCWAKSWASGSAQEFFTDGEDDTEIAKSVATPTGTLVIPGGPLAFGAGPRAYWQGVMGLVRLASSARSAAWIKAEQRNRINPLLMLAGGAFKLPGETAPPVAFPDTATANGSTASINITPLANDTGTGLSLVSCAATSGTAVVLNSTTIRYTQSLTFSGTAYITYVARDSLNRQTTSVIAVAVTPPAVAAADDSFTVTVGTTVDLDVLANDTPAGLLEVDAITVAATIGSVAPTADKTKARYVAPGTPGSGTFGYRAKLIGGSSTANATASISVQAVSSIPSNLYAPPHRPLLESDIVVWNYGDARPADNWDKYCLLVWPDVPLTGSGKKWNISNARWAGIFEVGYRYHPIGDVPMYRHGGSKPNWTRLEPPLLGFIGALERSFANNAPNSLKQPNKRPFVWSDGGIIDTCSRSGDAAGIQQSCWWGDFWKSGIQRNTAGTYASWASDYYLMRTRIDNGYYFFSGYKTASTEYQDPHSDWMQNEALCLRSLNVWRFFGKISGQGFYLTGDQSLDANGYPKGIIPRDAYSEFSYVHSQPMPYGDLSTLFGGTRSMNVIALAQKHSTNCNPTQWDYVEDGVNVHIPAGRYYPLFLGPECYFEEQLPDQPKLSNIIGTPYNFNGSRSKSATKLTMGVDRRALDAGVHDYMACGATSGGMFNRPAGYFKSAVSIVPPNYTMVPDSYCGLPRRITNAADLLSYLDNRV